MMHPPVSMCHVVGCLKPAAEISWCEQLSVGIQLCQWHSDAEKDTPIQLDLNQVKADHILTMGEMQQHLQQ